MAKMPGILVVVVLFVIAIVLYFGLAPGIGPLPAFVRGLIAGIGVASIFGGVAWALLLGDAAMYNRIGAFGETLTSEQLRELGRRWTILNNVWVPSADETTREIDHIAVGPGGILVIDSKLWPTRTHRLDTTTSPYIDGAARGVSQQAGVVRWFLRDVVEPEVVRPSVMFWGSRLSSSDDHPITTKRNGVQVVHGREAKAWRLQANSLTLLDDRTIATTVSMLEPHLAPKQRLRDIKPPPGWAIPFVN